jgi:hypothetical protein
MQQSFSFHDQERIALGAILFFLLFHAFASAFLGVFGILYIFCVGTAGLLAFVYPRAGLLGALITTILFEQFFTLVPLVIGDSVYKLYPLDIILTTSFLGVLIFLLKKDNLWPRYQKSDGFLYTFWLFVSGMFVVSLLWLADVTPALAFSTFKQYVFYPLLIVVLPLVLRTWGDVLWFFKTLFGAALGIGIFLALGILLGGGLWTEYTPLTTSGVRLLAFPHGFYASLAFIVTVLIFASGAAQKSYKKEWFYLAGGLFSLAALASLMRHLWLSLGVVFILATLLTYKQGLGKKILRYFFINAFPVGILFATLWFGVSLFPDSGAALRSEKVVSVVSDRISSIGNQYDESLVWRGAVWQSAFVEFATSPIVGIGFGRQVPVELGDYQKYIEVRDMHNSWFALLIQAGVVGVLLFGAFLRALLWPLWKKRKEDIWFLPVMIVLSLVAFQSLVFLSQPYLETNLLGIWFWLTLGVARSFYSVDRLNNKITGENYANS